MNEVHGTAAEMDFLRVLGTGEFSVIKTPRLELLEKYKKAMFTRKKWGLINFEKVLSYVERLIEAEGEGK